MNEDIRSDDIRPGEIAAALPETFDAGVYFIGRIRTPWTRRDDCPKNARGSDAACTIELDPRYAAALDGVASCTHLVVLYFMDRGAARPAGAGAAPRRPARHLCVALAGAPEPDRHERRAARAHRGHDAHRRRARLPRRHAADRHQAVFRVRRLRCRTPWSGGARKNNYPPAQNICRSVGARMTSSGAYSSTTRQPEAAQLVVHPDIAAGVQRRNNPARSRA